MGTLSFVQTFVQRKVEGWVREVEKLSKFAETQPHSAYAAFTHGLMSKWNYLLRVVDWDTLSSAELLQPLESAIQSRFIPAITGQAPPGKHVRDLLALPVCGGLGLRNPTNMAKEQHTASQQISAPLVDRIVNQEHHLGECHAVQKQTKVRIRLAQTYAAKCRSKEPSNSTSIYFATLNGTVPGERSIKLAFLAAN